MISGSAADGEREILSESSPPVIKVLNGDRAKFAGSLFEVERSAFGEDEALSEDALSSALANPQAVWVTLQHGDNDVPIGYTYAVPSDVEGRAYIPRIAIQKDFQSRGLVGVLHGALEQELRAAGYREADADAEMTNGFAWNLLDHVSEEGRHRSHRVLARDILHNKQRMNIVFSL